MTAEQRVNKAIHTFRENINISIGLMNRIVIQFNNLITQICGIIDEAIIDETLFIALKDKKSSDQQREAKFLKVRDQYFHGREDITAKVIVKRTTPEELKIFRENNEKAISTCVYIANYMDVTADFYKLNAFSDEQRVTVKMDNIQRHLSN